jgi:hypothetical protein
LRLRRFVHFDVCRIESTPEVPYVPAPPGPYEARLVDQLTFDSLLCPELANVEYGWAFERGDWCVASLHDGVIVGYSFNTHLRTPVTDGLEFYFPPGYSYAYASLTAKAHRGRKLEPERWKVRTAALIAAGESTAVIWYVSVANLASRAANQHAGLQLRLHGYAAFVRLFGRWFTFASPACHRFGAGFARAEGSLPGRS